MWSKKQGNASVKQNYHPKQDISLRLNGSFLKFH